MEDRIPKKRPHGQQDLHDDSSKQARGYDDHNSPWQGMGRRDDSWNQPGNRPGYRGGYHDGGGFHGRGGGWHRSDLGRGGGGGCGFDEPKYRSGPQEPRGFEEGPYRGRDRYGAAHEPPGNSSSERAHSEPTNSDGKPSVSAANDKGSESQKSNNGDTETEKTRHGTPEVSKEGNKLMTEEEENNPTQRGQSTTLPLPPDVWKKLDVSKKMRLLCPDEDLFNRYVVAEFPNNWHERCLQAVEETLSEVRNKREMNENSKKISEELVEEYDDGFEPDTPPDMSGDTYQELPSVFVHFIQALPECTAMHFGFHVFPLSERHRQTCYCPCSKKMQTWRNQFGLEEITPCDITGKNAGRFFDYALCTHLKNKPHKLKHKVWDLDLHQIALSYLQNVYKDYLDKNLKHKSFYDKDGEQYLRAEAAQNRHIKTTIDELHSEVQYFKKEREKLLETISKMEKVNPEKADNLKQAMDAKDALAQEWNLPPRSPPILHSNVDLAMQRAVADCWFDSVREQVIHRKKGKKSIEGTIVLKNVTEDFELAALFHDLQVWRDDLFKEGYEETAKWVKECMDVCFNINVKLVKAAEDEKDDLGPMSYKQKQAFLSAPSLFDAGEKSCTAIDEGGPSRQFLSRVWSEMPHLKVPLKKAPSNTPDNRIPLFRSLNGQLWPVEDDHLVKLFKDENKAREIVRPIARAIGRLMLHALTSRDGDRRLTIDGHMLPPLYRRYLLQGIRPTSPKYHARDLLGDAVECHCAALPEITKRKEKDTVYEYLKYFMDEANLEEDYSAEVKLRKAMEICYIDKCSILLDGLSEGLGICEKSKGASAPCDFTGQFSIQGDSKFLGVLQNMSLEAIDTLFFSKHRTSAEDVISVLKADYRFEEEGCTVEEKDGKGKTSKRTIVVPEKFRSFQRMILDTSQGEPRGHLVDYLRTREKVEEDFPADFVELVTGCRFLPQHGLYITIEFNAAEFGEFDEGALPVCHTCQNVLKMPSSAYWGDASVFQEKLKKTFEYCKGSFNMA